MAPNANAAAEESEKREEEVCGYPVEDEDEIDGVRGEYGYRRGYDDRENFVSTGDFSKRDDYELRKGGRVKRSNSGQRGDFDQRGESRLNRDFAKMGDEGMRDYGRGEYGLRKADYVIRRSKLSEPGYPPFPRDTSSGLQNWEDHEFPYGRLKGNYRQSRFDYDGKERRFDYEGDFDRYGYRREGSFYDTGRNYGRAPYARNMTRFSHDEPYNYGGSYGKEIKSLAYERHYPRPDYNGMYYGRFGNEIEYSMIRDQDAYEGYYGSPSRFGMGYGRDISRSRDNYLPRRNYYGIDNYEVGPYRRYYDVDDRDFFVGRYETDPFRKPYSDNRHFKFPLQTGYSVGRGNDVYSPSGRYGVEPNRGEYSKYHVETPRYSRNSSRRRFGDLGFEDGRNDPLERRPYLNDNLYGQYGKRAYGDDIMEGYGIGPAIPRRGYYGYRMGPSRQQEPDVVRRMSDGRSRVQFASDQEHI